MNGIVYSHEHICIDLSKEKKDPDCILNVLEEALDEFMELKKRGVTKVVDCSNRGMGVNWQVNEILSKKTGIEIVNSTGFYKDPFLPDYVSSSTVKDLEEIILEDLEKGAKVIGEIGTSHHTFTDNEMKVFLAAISAHLQTGAPIITHTTLGTMADEQVKLFQHHQVNMKKVIISHLALSNNFSLLLSVAKTGANLAFDTIGKANYLSDTTRIRFIKDLIDLGYRDQILMSMDLTRKSHLKKHGGKGYTYLPDVFVPKLKQYGVKEKDIQVIMCENFNRIIEE